MNVRSDLAMAYHMGYEDALAKRMPDATKAGVLNSYICTNSERTNGTCRNAPTVEDVLREFALKAAGRECMTMRSDLVDEYASKLQLREDA